MTALLALTSAGFAAPGGGVPDSASGIEAPLAGVQVAQQVQRRGFFEMLFGIRPATKPPPQAAPRRTGRSSSGRSSAPPPPPVEVVEKDENARLILVVGDFVAGAVARGLERAFADEARVVVSNRANGNSGLVRDDYYDWVGLLPGIVNEEKPDVVVVAIGSNDRQQIKDADGRYAPLSSDWERVYGERIAAISDTLKVYGQPFFWVGTAPMRSSSASRDMAYFNSLYEPRVEAAGGYYIDIWDGFANEDGRFVSSGPDVDGQLRALRTKDGINFTAAGRLKLAFYVEREMKRQIGFGTDETDILPLSAPTSQIEIGPDGVKRLVGPIVPLSGPRPGARDQLVDRSAEAAGGGEGEATPQELLVFEGKSLPQVPGRADDASWPPLRDDPAVPQPAALAGPDGAAN